MTKTGEWRMKNEGHEISVNIIRMTEQWLQVKNERLKQNKDNENLKREP